MIYCLIMASTAGIDLARAVKQKMAANARKYPTDTDRGRYQ
ncbi:hypothetical protein [Desulfofundulus salinus]|uniref:Nucleotide pyrophosphohydrolase n=1 Tax=Desulfofundulus salinus TaxID=2419843 RepID=A0A494WSW9_9FIRM|nr:hypothetical protein [Desulfofundulus salinum]RKO65853.1 hypothetical protein D7024_02020 [Desulfofundulus salinum]